MAWKLGSGFSPDVQTIPFDRSLGSLGSQTNEPGTVSGPMPPLDTRPPLPYNETQVKGFWLKPLTDRAAYFFQRSRRTTLISLSNLILMCI
jgi:hypothetical protein